MTQLATHFTPGPNAPIYEKLYRDVYRGLYLDLAGRMSALSALRELTSPDGGPSIPPPASRET
jgi:hypothetical protein